MLSKKKKFVVMAGMVALLVVTGCLSVFLNSQTQTPVAGTTDSYQSLFVTYRADRTATREQTMLYLDSIIADASSSEETVTLAQEQKLALTYNMELELVLEGLIKAIGFEDAFITSSTENVYVIVKSDGLTEDEANRILAIVTEETGKTAQNVIVQPVNTTA